MNIDSKLTLKKLSGEIITDAILVEILDNTIIWKYKYSDRNYEITKDNIIFVDNKPYNI